MQLVGGERLAIDAGDPLPILDTFARVGEVPVVDLDAARGEGGNTDLIRSMCRRARVRVGGGIRDVATARRWLDDGAHKIVLGTAAQPELLKQLPSDRVVVALDEKQGEVVTHGWRQGTGRDVFDRIRELRGLCSGFLVTFVDREGRLGGTDLARAAEAVAAAGEQRVTIAGGITTVAEVAALDRLGADAQVGMALYAGELSLADAFAAPLVSEREDGLWPTVVVDEAGVALGLCWSSAESLRQAVEQGRGIYHSRKRGVWIKGQTSGATQRLLGLALDCDRDAIRFTVRQDGAGFCHREERTCWGDDRGIRQLMRRIRAAKPDVESASLTARLLASPELLAAKLREEAQELAQPDADVAAEAADVLYFTMVRLAAAGATLADVDAELDRRAMRVTRRSCEAKEGK